MPSVGTDISWEHSKTKWRSTPRLNTKEIHLPLRDKGQGIRDKDRRQRTREKGNKGEGGGRDRRPRAVGDKMMMTTTKDCLLIERRQVWHISKRWAINVKRKP